MNLLFVCSGNTCRSPLALAAWRAVTREAVQVASGERKVRTAKAPTDAEGLDNQEELPTFTKRGARLLAGIEASSAGLCAHDGDDAALFARRIAEEWGEDLEAHQARLFRAADAKTDLILTMTASQADVLRAHFGLDEKQIKVLGSYLPDSKSDVSPQFEHLWGNESPVGSVFEEHDILDPYGGSMEAYQECATQVRRAVIKLARSLVQRK